MKIIFFEYLRRERRLILHKMLQAGIDPSQIVISARIRNLWQNVRHAWRNQCLFWQTRMRETTAPNAIYRSYGR